jgi:CheY-like chemotaxis protein
MIELAALLRGLAGIAWPIAFVAVALLFRRFIAQMLTRESVNIRIAGMEVSVADAAKQTGEGVADLLKRVADLEDRIGGKFAPAEPRDPSDRERGFSVLWVDDYPANNAFLIQQFEQEGIRIRKEISTRSAIAALGQERFGAIISDLGRQEDGVENKMAGLDLGHAVRSAGDDTPILIFAGLRGLSNRERLKAAGATEVTTSSVDVVHFVNAVRTGQ